MNASLTKTAVLCIAASAAAWLPASASRALVIEHNLAFGAFNQSPFVAGGAYDKSDTTFVGPRWPTKPLNLVIPPGCPGELCLRPNLTTSGAFGAELGYAISGGRLSIGYPVGAKVTLPNSVSPGTPFTVGIESGLKSSGFGFERATLDANPVLAPWVPVIQPGGTGARHEPFLDATFPSFATWLDLVAEFEGSIGLRGTAPFVGTGTIYAADLPGFAERLTILRMDRSGISTDIPLEGGATSIPFGTAIPVVPSSIPGGQPILTATLHYPDLNPKGTLDGSFLRGADQKTVAELDMNVLQLLGSAFPLLQLLENDIPIAIGNIHYTLLNVTAGLAADIRQEIVLSATVQPRITFDTPVSIIDANGARSAPTNTVWLPENGEVRLELANAGSNRLEARLGYGLVAHVVNATSMVLSGSLKAKALQADIDVDILGLEIDETLGPVIPEFGPEGKLFEFSLFDSSFDIPLNEILTGAIGIDVQPPARSLIVVDRDEIGVGGTAFVSYTFRERCGELFCSPEEVQMAGFERTDAYGGIVFEALDEIVFTSGGPATPPRSYGHLYCVSCVDADLAAEVASSSFVTDEGFSAYINDYLLTPPSGPDCEACLDDFLAAHTGLSGHSGTPLVVHFDRTREFFASAAVPATGTMALLGIGLVSLLLVNPRSGRNRCGTHGARSAPARERPVRISAHVLQQ